MFDELEPDELIQARDEVALAGLEAARRLAATRLLDGPAEGLGKPANLVAALMARDKGDARWERLAPFELRWALLVVRLMAQVGPAAAVVDARRRGASWAGIASALGIKQQSAHARFRHVVEDAGYAEMATARRRGTRRRRPAWADEP